MTVLSIKTFNGEIPRLPADRLPEDAAQRAVNCDFAHEELRSLKGLGLQWNCAGPVRGLFTDDGLRFFVWDKPTRAFLHPTIDDTAGRILYQTHGAGVRVALAADMKAASLSPTAPAQSWKAGVKRPTAEVQVTLSGTPVEGGEIETVSYAATAINLWGEESAATDPVLIDVPAGQTATLTLAHTPDPDERALQGVAFYRTYASNQSADFYLINATPAPLSSGVATFVDATTAVQTTTVLQTAQWDGPPAGAGNLTYLGNGFFAVSAGKDLVFSEPYRPHAWPYRMTLPHGIVGIAAVEGGALVTTTAEAYLISGAHPTQVAQQLLPVEQAGWSDTAMTRLEGSAVYASNDGLVSVAGGQPSLDSSQAMFTRKDWREAYGAARLNLRLATHDGRLLGLVDPAYPVSATAEPFLLDLQESGGSYCRLDVGATLYAAIVSATTDELYVGTATGFAAFATGDDLPLEWQSADMLYPAPVAFAAAIVDCTGAFSIEIRADGVPIHTEAVTARKAFRLPPAATAYRWSVKVTGTGTLRAVDLGASFSELKQV